MIKKIYMLTNCGAFFVVSISLLASGYPLFVSIAPIFYMVAFSTLATFANRVADLFNLKTTLWGLLTCGWFWAIASGPDYGNSLFFFPLAAIVWWLCLSHHVPVQNVENPDGLDPEHLASTTAQKGGRPIPVFDPRLSTVADELRVVRQSRNLSRSKLAELISRDVDMIGTYKVSEQLVSDVEESRTDYRTAAMLLKLSRNI